MKFQALISIPVLLTVAQVQAAPTVCQNISNIQKAAEKAFAKRDQPRAGDATYSGTTKDGKDKWIVQMSVQEECMSTAVVYTVKGTCRVTDAMEIGNRDCG